jgi:hypothetical protein
VIAPHGVHGNAVCGTSGGGFVHRPDTDAGVLQLLLASYRSQLLLIDRANLPALVVAAGCADAVRRLGFLALRAQARADLHERVMGATLAAAGLGMAAFRIRHLCRSFARAP